MNKIIIDGEGAIFGRLCSFAAKKALEGNEIIIVNSEKVVISGNKPDIIKKFMKIKEDIGGHSLKGPKYSRLPYKMLKRGIRGMLPDHRKGIGKQAFMRIRCYEKIPEEFKNQKMIKSKKKTINQCIQLKELSQRI